MAGREILCFAAALALLVGWAAWPASAGTPQLSGVRGDYVLHCGGCHGITGDPGHAAVPRLQGRVGRLLCTDAGRRYATRLPNVAKVRGLDDVRLAALLTFVMDGLGGAERRRAYSADEIGAGRAHALTRGDLKTETARVWREVDRRCPSRN